MPSSKNVKRHKKMLWKNLLLRACFPTHLMYSRLKLVQRCDLFLILPHFFRFFLSDPKNTITVGILISSFIYHNSRSSIHFSGKKEQSNTKVPTKHLVYLMESKMKNS